MVEVKEFKCKYLGDISIGNFFVIPGLSGVFYEKAAITSDDDIIMCIKYSTEGCGIKYLNKYLLVKHVKVESFKLDAILVPTE